MSASAIRVVLATLAYVGCYRFAAFGKRRDGQKRTTRWKAGNEVMSISVYDRRRRSGNLLG